MNNDKNDDARIPSITVVCCIESGSLEENTVRLVESLRRFGGIFQSIPIVAVTPRFGPPLSRRTLLVLDSLNARHVRFRARNSYSWNGFLNKPLALAHIEQSLTTESICWLDSDILVLNEPVLLALSQSEDFLASISDFANNGTNGAGAQEQYWRKVARIVGVDLASVPWVRTPLDSKRIRAYFNSGVFVYRRNTSFGQHFLKSCLDIFDARIKSSADDVFFIDQVALGLTAARMGLRVRYLPLTYNFPIGSFIPERYISVAGMRDARLLHIHDAMYSPFWPTALDYLRQAQPQFADWIAEKGPIEVRNPLVWRAMGKALRVWRDRHRDRFSKEVGRPDDT